MLITPADAAAKIWWSPSGAFVESLVGVTVYVVFGCTFVATIDGCRGPDNRRTGCARSAELIEDHQSDRSA